MVGGTTCMCSGAVRRGGGWWRRAVTRGTRIGRRRPPCVPANARRCFTGWNWSSTTAVVASGRRTATATSRRGWIWSTEGLGRGAVGRLALGEGGSETRANPWHPLAAWIGATAKHTSGPDASVQPQCRFPATVVCQSVWTRIPCGQPTCACSTAKRLSARRPPLPPPRLGPACAHTRLMPAVSPPSRRMVIFRRMCVTPSVDGPWPGSLAALY